MKPQIVREWLTILGLATTGGNPLCDLWQEAVDKLLADGDTEGATKLYAAHCEYFEAYRANGTDDDEDRRAGFVGVGEYSRNASWGGMTDTRAIEPPAPYRKPRPYYLGKPIPRGEYQGMTPHECRVAQGKQNAAILPRNAKGRFDKRADQGELLEAITLVKGLM